MEELQLCLRANEHFCRTGQSQKANLWSGEEGGIDFGAQALSCAQVAVRSVCDPGQCPVCWLMG